MRALLLFVIGLVFGGTGGYLAGGGMGPSSHHEMSYGDMDHTGMTHDEAGHDHSAMTPWSGPDPVIALALSADTGTAQNLHIMTTGFVFAPEQVNGPVTPGTGHAHVYVNGEKIARAYSAWMHLADLPAGATIRVTLNANDHTHWALNGVPVAAEIAAP